MNTTSSLTQTESPSCELPASLLGTDTTPPSKGNSLPGDLAIWIFIWSELLVFAIFFTAYAIVRAHNIELFESLQPRLAGNPVLFTTVSLCLLPVTD